MTSVAGHPPSAAPAAEPEAPIQATLELVRPSLGPITIATLLGAGAIGAGIGLIATAAWLISRASQRPEESALALAIVAVQFFGLSRGLFRYGQRLVGHDAAFRSLADLRSRSYARLEQLAPAGLPAFRSGDLLARVVHDIDSLQDLILRVLPPILTALIVGAVTVVFMWLVLPAAGVLLLLALLIAMFALTWLTGRMARRTESLQAGIRGDLTTSVVELLEGAPDLAALGAIEIRQAQASALDARLNVAVAATAGTTGVGQGAATLLSGLAMWGALAVGVAAVRDGALAGVMLAVIALVPLAAFELLTDLPTATQTLQRVRRSAFRTLEVLDAAPPVSDPSAPARVPEPGPGHRQVLEVRGLHVRYESEQRWALAELDLQLVSGRRVAVVGRSGAGKSTLAEVLLRFLPYQLGSVTLNGTSIDALNGDDYRRVVGLLSQSAHIFDTTLEENLRIARRGATVDELRAALGRARLLDWVDGLPSGLGTRVGAHGDRLSGGQRQRLALARVLLAEFPVLVADEPGEHLDTATADALTADLLDGVGGQAILLITHRLAGLEAVDEVIVLERGLPIERGTHAELLAADGAYASMWQRELSAAALG